MKIGEKKDIIEIEEALFVIDMNNGFCNKGLLADPSIKRIVPAIKKLIEYFLRRGEGFFIVNDEHTEDSVELLRYLRHCMGDEESEIIDELAEYKPCAHKEFRKNSRNALFAPGMMEMLLQMKKLKRVIVVGCCTDLCVQNFALALRDFFDQFNMNVDVIVPKDAVETYDIPGVHNREEKSERTYSLFEDNGIKLVKTLKEGE